MHISQLVINGFKTFNSKTSLEFGDGITAVVGPNGCGKTNIVDAIRWVLGEQKYSTLRSARMEDVIFNGAKGTKPMSMCEVYLTVKNDRGKLPVEYTDVEIGRRLYRDGESEYFINRNSCRLKDVSNLFVDTGMGADSYSVIELKMIEQILSESDEGRKFLFEEAAGINKYKTQRRLSIKKFEATKFDLERINDIISEVDAKVKGLNLQLKRFKRHASLVEKLRENELDLSTLQINKYLELSNPLRKKIEEYSHLRKEKVSDQDVQESELVKLKDTYSQQEIELQSIRKEISKLDDKREDYRQKVVIWQEQNKSADKDIDRLNGETTFNRSRIEKFELSIKDINKELDTIIPQIDEKLSIFKGEQSKFTDLENNYKSDQASVEKIQSERWELQKEITDNRSLTISTESTIKERESQKEKLSTRIKLENESIEELQKKETEFDNQIELFNKNISELSTKKTEFDNQLIKLDKEISELVTKKQSNEVLRDSLENQLQFYQDLVVSQSDLPTGLKYVLDNKIEMDKIIDTVSNVFSTESKYEKAISTVLGEFSQSLICKDKDSAIQIIENIQDKKAGKIAIIPYDETKNKEIKLPNIPKSDSIIDRASNLINCDNNYSQIAELLLGNVLIVNDLKSAMKDGNLANWSLVDLNGVTYINSILKNPSSSKGTSIGRKKKIEDLQSKITDLRKTLNDIDGKLNTTNEKKSKTVNELDKISSDLKHENESLENSKLEFQRIKYDIENKIKIISESKKELKEIDSSIGNLNKSISLLLDKVGKSEKIISGIQNRLADANEKLEISRKERDDHHQAMQDIRIELLNNENKRDNLNSQKKTADTTIFEIQNRQNKIVEEIKNIKEQSASRTSKISEMEKELVGINSELQKNRNNLENKEELYRKNISFNRRD